MNIFKKFKDYEKGNTMPDPLDLSNPEHRKQALRHFDWADHGILRRVWTNFYEIAPGAYRSNHPNEEQFKRYAEMGIKSVINLRGVSKRPHFHLEKKITDELGLARYDIALHARAAPPKKSILELLDTFNEIEQPFILHCKSGADRAGLASALYLLLIEKAPIAEARKMLSLRFLHIKWSSTGVLDYFLDVYEARQKETGISFEDWVRSEYDADALNRAYFSGSKSAK